MHEKSSLKLIHLKKAQINEAYYQSDSKRNTKPVLTERKVEKLANLDNLKLL